MRAAKFTGQTIFAVAVFAAVAPPLAGAQVLAPARQSGQSVTPAFEGWYKNPDGTFSISFGYYNRNSVEVVEIPVGAQNYVEPGEKNQGQPTQFQPRRQWGVFAVKVPANFGISNKITWTLINRGDTIHIAGSLDPLWEIDALQGEAGSGNTPPALKFAEGGAEGRGPGGITSTTLTTTVGTPLTIDVWARDDGRTPAGAVVATASRGGAGAPGRGGRAEAPVTLTFLKHQGPGAVTFAPPVARVPNAGGKASTVATFSKPGEYLVRVRANDASGTTGAGHAQCCWTNGFVKVTVTQ